MKNSQIIINYISMDKQKIFNFIMTIYVLAQSTKINKKLYKDHNKTLINDSLFLIIKDLCAI